MPTAYVVLRTYPFLRNNSEKMFGRHWNWFRSSYYNKSDGGFFVCLFLHDLFNKQNCLQSPSMNSIPSGCICCLFWLIVAITNTTTSLINLLTEFHSGQQHSMWMFYCMISEWCHPSNRMPLTHLPWSHMILWQLDDVVIMTTMTKQLW